MNATQAAASSGYWARSGLSQAVALGCRVWCPFMQKSEPATYESRRSHHLRECACAPDWLILFVMENDSGRRFPPAPKSGSASTPTLPTTPAAVACGYPYVAWGERMPVATVARNLRGGNLAAAVRAREWNDGRAISRNRAPATNPLLHADSPLKATGFRSA